MKKVFYVICRQIRRGGYLIDSICKVNRYINQVSRYSNSLKVCFFFNPRRDNTFWPGPNILTGSVSNDYLIDSVSNYNLVDQDCLTNILGIVWWLSDDFLMTTLLKQYNGLSFQNWKNPKICWNLLEVLFSQIALIGKTWSVSANKNIWPLTTATNKSHK